MEATAFIPLGMGAAVIGAGLGIGKLAAAAAESIARQPEAASEITGAVNLPLFLLEGVAIIALALTFAMLFFTLTRNMDNPLVQLDPGLYVWTILTFLLLFFLLTKFAWKPLLKALAEREEKIRSSLEKADEAQQQLEHLGAEGEVIIG